MKNLRPLVLFESISWIWGNAIKRSAWDLDIFFHLGIMIIGNECYFILKVGVVTAVVRLWTVLGHARIKKSYLDFSLW